MIENKHIKLIFKFKGFTMSVFVVNDEGLCINFAFEEPNIPFQMI